MGFCVYKAANYNCVFLLQCGGEFEFYLKVKFWILGLFYLH